MGSEVDQLSGEISVFCHGVVEAFYLLGCYVA